MSGEISPSLTAVATVTGLVTKSQMVAPASTMLTVAPMTWRPRWCAGSFPDRESNGSFAAGGYCRVAPPQVPESFVPGAVRYGTKPRLQSVFGPIAVKRVYVYRGVIRLGAKFIRAGISCLAALA